VLACSLVTVSCRYNLTLRKAKEVSIKKGAVAGLAMGVIMLVVFFAYALGFWFGTGVVLGEYLPHLHTNFTIGNMLIVSITSLVQ